MTEPEPLKPDIAVEDQTAAATQLKLVLDATTGAVEEEFKRTERLEQKSRNQATFTATIFAGAQALTVGLFNGVLTDGKDSSFIVYLAVLGGIATVCAGAAFTASYVTWRPRRESVVEVDTIAGEDYLGWAAVGNANIGMEIIRHYKVIVEDRRRVNGDRVKALRWATRACVVTMVVVAAELVVAFIAVAVN